MFVFSMNSMLFDDGISIEKIADHNSYFVVTGSSASKLKAYLLAEKLLYAKSLIDFKFVDVVPSWSSNKFVFYFIKSPNHNLDTSTLPITIESPLARDPIEKKITIQGKCLTKGAEIIISGDLSGKTNCQEGQWSVELSTDEQEVPLIGIKISFWQQKQQPYRLFRSLLVSKIDPSKKYIPEN